MTIDKEKLDKLYGQMGVLKTQSQEIRIKREQILAETYEMNEKIESLQKRINKLEGNCYYVYLVFVDDDLRYIGKGKGDRYKHAISGASSVAELNRDFFNGCHIEVRLLLGGYDLSEKEALKQEMDALGSNIGDGLYNKNFPKQGEYEYMDCNFKSFSKLIARHKGTRKPSV
jgi:hypothetical protein